ncbi:cytochrome P450 [Yarrowia lipolytica]|uniref:YALI0A20130p n=2 Tax=Yarrowia lipolytica TaxID=4952 RepID=Q6CGD9_YARLI|nr:YALI0A20130p [Yarrowia lipolytica CLIB122]AOW00918.1 hypothetical protein YALI1_A21175g [Yarrowia lipolytica]KAB8283292.1 cytochrome P450 [Yarrowia lipolytica]KAE8174165.1 cytochrome P450 [Yarrowia lipolytica]KAJ8051862.1 cytochrome P450 [Yarrowia lipolytica]RDW28035.1 cytochrome P450 [Yarrowia lipolytica]|eukprot:XP_500273.1 YALI0A20130p [Yarrowia lipolytica CLIB122]
MLEILIGVTLFFTLWRVLVLADLKRRQKKSGYGYPPIASNGLLGWRGLVHQLSGFVKDIGPAGWGAQFKEHGKTHLYPVFPTQLLVTRDPDNVKAILATQFKDFSFGIRKEALCPSLGYGIFTVEGSSWSHSRALLRPQFSREQISRLDSVEHHFQEFAQCVDNFKGEYFDIQKLFFAQSMDTSTDFLLGESVGCLKELLETRDGDESSKKFGANFQHAFDRVQRLVALRVVFQENYWIIGDVFFRNEFRQVNELIQKFVQGYVDKALKARAHKAPIYTNPDKYIFLYELARDTTNPRVLRDQVLNILIAGRDTTAATLSWLMFELAQKPHIFHKLRKAVIEDFGTTIENISFESLKQCEYLRYVLNEVLRLHPVVPINLRVALKDTTLPRGGGPNGDEPIFVPKGQKINYAVYWTHRDEQYWGEDAEEFKPERWDTTNHPGPLGKGWEFLPFNGGPRICLGQQFALTEMGYILTRLVQEYSDIGIDEEYHDRPLRVRHSITMSHGDGVHVRLSREGTVVS